MISTGVIPSQRDSVSQFMKLRARLKDLKTFRTAGFRNTPSDPGTYNSIKDKEVFFVEENLSEDVTNDKYTISGSLELNGCWIYRDEVELVKNNIILIRSKK